MRPIHCKATLISFCFLILCTISANCGTIYVKTDGSDSNDGSSWGLAKKTVQAGINGAVSGDEVWVAAGTYGSMLSINAKAGVKLYGGFPSGGGAWATRNTTVNKTILDGNGLAGRHTVVSVPSSATPATVIDGFVIRNGYSWPSQGGGISCATSSSPTISNNVIIGNTAGQGGAIYCSGSCVVTNNVIQGNICTGQGGAVRCAGSAVISNNIIRGNSADDLGGAIYASENAVTTNNTIAGNYAHSGGGIYWNSATCAISNNVIAFNSSGIRASVAPAVFSNNCVYGNSAGQYDGWPNQTGLNGNISADPGFAGATSGELHIQANSPCVNAGSNGAAGLASTDIDGQARMNGVVDIGADESYGETFSPELAIVRVSTTGNDANDGSTWASAKLTIQAAADSMAARGGGEVWVRAGLYPDLVTLPSYVCAYGGFAGTETERDTRDWRTNVTNTGRWKFGTGHLVSRMDGFRIAGCGDMFGGGIYCEHSSPTIVNNVISGNTAYYAGTYGQGKGGGIYCSHSQAVISNNTITQNIAVSGGGIYCEYDTSSLASNPTISNNIIAGNTSSATGGGVLCSSATVCGNTIVSNSAHDNGGGVMANLNLSASNNILAFNTSTVAATGGGIAIYAGGAATLSKNDLYQNTPLDYSGTSAGLTDVSLDPKFVDKTGGDYHITATSPCQNTGDDSAPGIPSLDIDGQGRRNGLTDIGADEYWGTSSIGGAKNGTNSTVVDTDQAIVTASFSDFFYIESSDRCHGIRVRKVGHTVMQGWKTHVVGITKTNSDGEKYIEAISATRSAPPNSSGSVPLLLPGCSSLGGADRLYDPFTGAGQRGTIGARGPNNIGLLIRVVGRVLSAGSSTFIMNDGSKEIKAVVPSSVTLPAVGAYVVVTGISSCERPGTDLLPLLRVRRQTDIVTLKAP